MDKFSSLLDLRDDAVDTLNSLLSAIQDSDDFCDREWPDLVLARSKIEQIVQDFSQAFPASLVEAIEFQAKAEEDLADQLDGTSY